jgi:hypothetical protein
MQLIGHNDLGGYGNGGEGFAEINTADERRVLYIAHESGPKCFSVVDVTDPAQPVLLSQTDVPDSQTRCNSLDVSGQLLLVANQTTLGGPNAGLRIYDLDGDPVNPREIGFFDTSGPYSRGVHYVWFADGRYAYLSTGMPDFQPRRPEKDDQIFVIVDLADPAHPTEVGRWWWPGTREGDPEPLPTPNSPFDNGCRMHNTDVYPGHPDRAYVGYIDCGIAVLDISDKAHPTALAMEDDSPPTLGYAHTVLPVGDFSTLVVTHEAVENDCADAPKQITIWRNAPDMQLEQISTIPLPDNAGELCSRGGRFGAHNVYEPAPDEPAFNSTDIIFGSFFNGGVRAYDISDPANPREMGYYIPSVPEASPTGAVQINDVYVDDRGVIFAVDRFVGGLYVLTSPLTGNE